ncbi:hypothetical protein DS969_25845 [Escherichia coli]|nr:hypothetical protein DS969_25845 [Escherichia coli]
MVEAGKPVDGELLQFLSPLGWEHINLTGDYVWRDFFRILRAPLSHLRKAEREDGRPGPRPRAPGARGRRADPRHGPRADAAAGAPEGRQRGRARP